MYVAERVNLSNPFEVDEIKSFLEGFDLSYEEGIDYTVAVRVDGVVKATCSKDGEILKCFAVDDVLQGEGITNIMIKKLQDKLFDEGKFHSFIFTKPIYTKTFESLGYRRIEESGEVVLLENGFKGIEKTLDEMERKYGIEGEARRTALVMNCNPFTYGHRYLIEEASKVSEEVLVFVVEEDRSVFPFGVRYDLIKKGVEDLKNVRVIPGGKYIISSATFPAYFLKEKSVHLKEYTELDGRIFGRYFAEKFNIVKRMVGDEPYCDVTRAYNEALRGVLGEYGVEVEVISRKEEGESAISASRVRALLKNGEDSLKKIEKLVPPTTLEFLISEEGKLVIEKIRKSEGRH